ncbi:hypothetical protein SASPL_128194 [Salvia splendens]|uniref:Uncharacterized protein n=1 Tax=Salvia splendens TaxID=180675 RepID=A0A8X8ZN93_SALSN|nr:hypothetical protein SASPL_128194 [Salvia splendens]
MKTKTKTVRLGGEKKKKGMEKVKSSLSSKALLMSKMVSWRKVDDCAVDDEEEDDVVCKKTIIKGDKCRPIDFVRFRWKSSAGLVVPVKTIESLELRRTLNKTSIWRRMDADTALELVKKGATLLALDVPPYTLFGIDTQMFSVGPNFKGVKMIPPGTHFIYYSSCNREGSEFSPIIGFFINASSSEVIVRRWDQKEERLVKVLEEEEDRYSDAVKRLEFDMQLGPYALNQYGDWIHLSNFITKDTLERLGRYYNELTSLHDKIIVIGGVMTWIESLIKVNMQNSKFSGHEKKSQKQGCYYTTVPRVVKQKGIYGEDITSLNLDKTHLLETILIKEYGGDENALLAELQFAFIAFLMGQSLQAFVQWKLLVSLLLGCTESPLRSRSSLFTKFMKVIYYQLKFGFQKEQKFTGDVPQGVSALLEESWLSSDSFLHRLCKDFFSVVFEAPVVDGDLLTWTRRLRSLLEETIGWNFEENGAADGVDFDEEDEYAPVVVNLDEGVF